MNRMMGLCVSVALLSVSAIALVPQAGTASTGRAGDLATLRTALDEAEQAAQQARERSADLEEQAREQNRSAEKAQSEAAALAAEIQEAEAGAALAEARLRLIREERRQIDLDLAQKRQPLVKLAAALQRMTGQPKLLSVLQPGSLRETVYVRAVLDSTIPVIRQRTAGLRASLDRSRTLAAEASRTRNTLKESRQVMDTKRRELLALSTAQRQASTQSRDAARREAYNAQNLASEARSLDDLVGQLDRQGKVRTRLAALPGPRPRPGTGGSSNPALTVESGPSLSTVARTGPPSGYRLPVQGRVSSGFAEKALSGLRGSGIVLVPRRSAQVVAPAAGRVAFAGPYEGYDTIVIIEHARGWTSLVTGLAQTDVRVGDDVIANTPLGRAADSDPAIGLELRQDGEPVNPLTVAFERR